MIVYWSPFVNPMFVPYISYQDPESIDSRLASMRVSVDSKLRDFRYCPSIRDQTKNLYALKFPVDYSLTFDIQREYVQSDLYNQEFFDNMIRTRSFEPVCCTYRICYIFVAEDSLEVEVTSPYLSENIFSNSTYILPGKFDIGKWLRPVDCSFLVREGISNVPMNKGDDWAYINFLTDKKVVFKKFYFTDKLNDIMTNILNVKTYQKVHFSPLSSWYDLYQKSKMKNLVLREIKENLMDRV